MLDIKEMVYKLYQDRSYDSVKTDYGKTLIIAGSNNYPGAAIISSMFAELSGCGYVTLSTPKIDYKGLSISPNICHLNFDGEDDFILSDLDLLKRYNSILFGNGIKESINNYNSLKLLINNIDVLVLDATALTILAKDINLLNRSIKNKIILTPHLGELNKLLNINLDSRSSFDYINKTKEFCLNYKANILIKSYDSVFITDNGEVYKSSYSPTSSLARAGSGDALAGYISGLLAYGLKYYSLDKIVRFADEVIHEAALLYEKTHLKGLINANILAENLVKVLEGYK